MIALRYSVALIFVLGTAMPKQAKGQLIPKPGIDKRGLVEEFCCCFAGSFKGRLGESEAYGTLNIDCTESTHSIFEDFNFGTMEPGDLPHDERYRATLDKLMQIMQDLKEVERQLEDADEFHNLSLLDQVKLVCNARNVRNICKINIRKIEPLEWIHFFDRAKKEDLEQLNAFQTNLHDRFQNVKDLIDNYCEEYSIKGLTFN